MKIQSKERKRPRLIEPFFNTELLPDNSYVTFINTTSQKNVTLGSHNIKKTLKSKKLRQKSPQSHNRYLSLM